MAHDTDMSTDTMLPPEHAADNPSLAAEAAEFDPDTGLEQRDTQKVAEALGRVLADSYQLFIKTQGVHWNLAGASFYGLHKLTEGQYEDLYEAIDEIAERIRALGHKAPASYRTYGELSNIKDEDRPAETGALVAQLVRDNGILCRTLRASVEASEEANDVVTADMLTSRLAKHEQNVWMLKMHIA